MGEGARVDASERRLLWLFARRREAARRGGGDGGSIGAMDTRPAISEIRCCDERRLGCAVEGDREKGGLTGEDGMPAVMLEDVALEGTGE